MFKFKVDIREYERGWGNKSIGVEEFDTYDDAVNRINEVNSKNTEDRAPEYYIQAESLNFQIDPKTKVKPTKIKKVIYLHSNKEENYDTGANLGLKGEALDEFSRCLYEVGIEVEIDLKTGKYKIIGVKE